MAGIESHPRNLSRRFFVRARPHVDVSALLLSIEAGCDEDRFSSPTEDLYFTSARGALKWLLSELRKQTGRSLVVGLQAFTCEAVVRAVAESGNIAEFHDITLESLSTPIAALESSRSDVLILTHLFGVPNPNYAEIGRLCRERGIVLVEDLAQAAGATVANMAVGDLADFSFYSFAVDKPVSAYRGGLLRVGRVQDAGEWQARYARLAEDSQAAGLADLSALYLLFLQTDPDVYHRGYRFPGLAASAMRRPRTVQAQQDWIRAWSRLPGYWLTERLSSAAERRRAIGVRRMPSIKRSYATRVMRDLPAVARTRHEWFELACRELSAVAPSLQVVRSFSDVIEAPARLAVLAPPAARESIVRWFLDAGLEAGLFNWPYVAAEYCADLTPRVGTEQFPESREAVRRIINLPLWSDLPWRDFAKRVKSTAPAEGY